MLFFGVPPEFYLFLLTLIGIALFHTHTLQVAATGFVAITLYKLVFGSFTTGAGLSGFIGYLQHEWVLIANLFMLLTGFTLLARHFEKSRLPVILPVYLPNDWKGGFCLLVLVFVLSAFLDNIAAALIGGAIAHQVYKAKVHVGYIAAIVAASNAGGSGSVIGDTTTTMIWIAGVAPTQVVHAYVAAATTLLVFGIIAARQQQAYSPILHHAHQYVRLDKKRLAIVLIMLLCVAGVNVLINTHYPQLSNRLPWVGLGLWGAILLTSKLRRHDWEILPTAVTGSLFLLLLVLCAGMMPVQHLPQPSWQSTLLLGFVSAFFDNIPLTALAIEQGSYDWGMLAFAVGFGGSMLWFGSSAGVALSNLFPEAKSTQKWLRHGWHVILAYVVGFGVLLTLLGWHPVKIF